MKERESAGGEVKTATSTTDQYTTPTHHTLPRGLPTVATHVNEEGMLLCVRRVGVGGGGGGGVSLCDNVPVHSTPPCFARSSRGIAPVAPQP